MTECCTATKRDTLLLAERTLGRDAADKARQVAHYANEIRLCLERERPNTTLALSFVARLQEIAAS